MAIASALAPKQRRVGRFVCGILVVASLASVYLSGEYVSGAFMTRADDVLASTYSSPVRYCGVTTTIFEPSEAMLRVLKSDVGKLIVVGDLKTNHSAWYDFQRAYADKVTYLSPDEQKPLGFKILKYIPWNHFSRKSIGYAYAVQSQCEHVFDFDDDNLLVTSTLDSLWNLEASALATAHHVYNPYPYFKPTTENQTEVSRIWPRGFPLQFISDEETYSASGISSVADEKGAWRARVAIVQSLANHNPDVDAVYRMSQILPVNFQRKNEVLLISKKTYVPWNAQATLVSSQAFFGLLLPATVPGRVSDIWRSYITARLLWDTDYHTIAFSSAVVEQFRNPHSYIKDFEDENDLYNKVDALLSTLSKWTSKGCASLSEAYLSLVTRLVHEKFLHRDDLKLAKAWVEDLRRLKYEWPKVSVRTEAFEPRVRHITDDRYVSSLQDGDVQTFNDGDELMKVNFVLSTRAQDGDLYTERLRQHLAMFANPSVYSMTLVLDDDVAANHAWATNLAQTPANFVEKFAYAALPSNHATLFDGIGRGFAKSSGYDRNQWNNFHSDEYADSSAKILAVVDSDTCIHTLITPDDFLTPDGRIIIHAAPGGSHWPAGDTLALGFAPKYDLMWTDIFPIFFWRDTLALARHDIASRLGDGSFEKAFQKFNRVLYSQFNILGNWALQNEPTRYKVVEHDVNEHGRSFKELTIGAHKRHGWCGHKSVFQSSCNVAFDVRRGNLTDESPFHFEAHDERVRAYVKTVSSHARARMKRSCEQFLDHFKDIACEGGVECHAVS